MPAADQTLRILSLLAGSRGPLPASMIATQLGLPRSTVYHLLATMQEHGFVMHLPEARRYGLGIAAFELSSAYARQEPIARIGRPLVASLVDRVGFSAHLAVPHGRDVLYVVEERAKGAPALVTDIDVRLPAQLTASGRAILAALPKAQLRALFPDRAAFVHRHEVAAEVVQADVVRGDAASVRNAGTDEARAGSADTGTVTALGTGTGAGSPNNTGAPAEPNIDRYSRLRTVLDATLTRGFAIERGSVTPGFSSVGLPVLDHREWPVAAIAVTFQDGEVRDGQLATLAAEVRETAATLATRIHGRSG